jgi:hypothetical protein
MSGNLNREELLKLLNAHGEQFLQSFSEPINFDPIPGPSRSRPSSPEPEWNGIQPSDSSESEAAQEMGEARELLTCERVLTY